MTDKQIIIDGVDVSGCVYFGSTMFPTKNCTMDSEYLHSCESCYCYYKQLKKAMNQIVDLNKKVEAKEQECEELKRQHQADKGLITSTGKMNYQLLQEYDKLKTENDELKEQLELNTANAVVIDMAQRLYKLKQTLTEIKEIAEKHKKDESVWNPYRQLDKILQKISEVEDEK